MNFRRFLRTQIKALQAPAADPAAIVKEARFKAQLAGLPDVAAKCRESDDAQQALCEALAALPIDGPLTVKQAADVLNIAPTTVYDLVAAGRIRHKRFGAGRGTIRIEREALDAYCQGPRSVKRL